MLIVQCLTFIVFLLLFLIGYCQVTKLLLIAFLTIFTILNSTAARLRRKNYFIKLKLSCYYEIGDRYSTSTHAKSIA